REEGGGGVTGPRIHKTAGRSGSKAASRVTRNRRSIKPENGGGPFPTRGERMNAPVRSIITPGCASVVGVPDELEARLRQAVARCAASLGESPESCRRAVEIAVLQRGLDALEVER